MMIQSVEEIQILFKEIDELLQETPETEKLEIYIIRGTVLLEQGLKPATKDIDLVVLTVPDFMLFENTLKTLAFKSTRPTSEYVRFNISQVLEREDFRIDLLRKLFVGSFRSQTQWLKGQENT